jgi:hypothetical protein
VPFLRKPAVVGVREKAAAFNLKERARRMMNRPSAERTWTQGAMVSPVWLSMILTAILARWPSVLDVAFFS